MKTFISHSEEQTEKIAAKLAKKIKKGSIIALNGDLGAGKTTFARGFIKSTGYGGRVLSPTFAIAHEYDEICHFDMYRICDEDSLYELGFDDYLNSKKTLLIEWSQNIINALPDDIITVELKTEGENERIIKIWGVDVD